MTRLDTVVVVATSLMFLVLFLRLARVFTYLSLRLDNHARLITALRRDIERIEEERLR